MEKTCFVTLVISESAARHARLMIHSLREFGGEYKDCPVWIFESEIEGLSNSFKDLSNTSIIQLALEAGTQAFPFCNKVRACSQAEEMCGQENCSLVWLNPECLIIKPPSEFELSYEIKAAFRPVHIRNIGSLVDLPPDPYWRAIFEAVGIDQPGFDVKSYLDNQRLRPYFNTHLFAVDPSLGLMQAWLERFSILAADRAFQRTACRDQLHKIFLNQAVLSALVVKMLTPDQIRILPSVYSYPLHLHDQIPESRRRRTLDELVIAVYEDDDSHPLHTRIEISQPLRSWLIRRTLPA